MAISLMCMFLASPVYSFIRIVTMTVDRHNTIKKDKETNAIYERF